MSNHELYQPKDFTAEEYARGNRLAKMVIDGGLGICKKCGAAEAQLDDHPTCEEHRAAVRAQL